MGSLAETVTVFSWFAFRKKSLTTSTLRRNRRLPGEEVVTRIDGLETSTDDMMVLDRDSTERGLPSVLAVALLTRLVEEQVQGVRAKSVGGKSVVRAELLLVRDHGYLPGGYEFLLLGDDEEREELVGVGG